MPQLRLRAADLVPLLSGAAPRAVCFDFEQVVLWLLFAPANVGGAPRGCYSALRASPSRCSGPPLRAFCATSCRSGGRVASWRVSPCSLRVKDGLARSVIGCHDRGFLIASSSI